MCRSVSAQVLAKAQEQSSPAQPSPAQWGAGSGRGAGLGGQVGASQPGEGASDPQSLGRGGWRQGFGVVVQVSTVLQLLVWGAFEERQAGRRKNGNSFDLNRKRFLCGSQSTCTSVISN